ncbi:MAG TPA: aldehyde dehydrogenase family protein [Bryobacteraceae bacterium]|nr:aldehyde dehydrogenase family protein [Bryobacteraceae bacterium]
MLADQDLLSIQEVRDKVEKVFAAWQRYRAYPQEKIDAIVEHVAAAARAHSERLAALAVEETGYGNARDKHLKNLLAAEVLPRRMRGLKTVGVLREFPEEKVVEIGVPVGVVAAILPTTNPTSTAIYKSLICLKSGNGIVISPHPRARSCTCATAAMLAEAALAAGAPEGILECTDGATLEGTQALMRHDRVSLILATGGMGIVKAAYSSGKPALGVGPGNVPALIDTSADVEEAVAKVVAGKSFDFGTVCSSEQAIVAEESLRPRILAALEALGAHLADEGQKAALAKLLILPNWTVNPRCVGQSPQKIAQMAGFAIAPAAPVICAAIEGVGKQHPLSAEKLSPVLSLLFVKDFAAALESCHALLKFGGLGHTAVIHARDEARIRQFGLSVPAMRVLVNTSSPQGSTGITTNVFPAMTLGCGAAAGNATSDNIGPLNLINIKRLAYEVRKPAEAFEKPLALAKVAGAGAPNRATVAAAVERYLAARGIGQAETQIPATSATAAEVVDRFLARRGSSLQAKSPALPPDPSPQLPIVDFVSEADVRAAIRQNRKIYIGPKTIVTPAARDLAEPSDILVMPGPEGTR